jgi:hypothetical protein
MPEDQMATTAEASPHDINALPPAMDYVQHNGTYEGFLALVKWGIITTAVVVVSLYCFIIVHQPVIGALLLLLIPVGAVVLVVTRSRAAA